MTEDGKFKKAVRARMAETGEKYTEARRALLATAAAPSTAVGDATGARAEVPPPTWALMRELLAESLRAPAWQLTAARALDVLEGDLGPTWPADAVQRFGRLPIPLPLLGGHTLAFVQTVELSLRLRQLRSSKGFARARKELRGNPEVGRVLHFSLQATVGTLAQRLGWGVHLEPGNPPADVVFAADGQRVAVETKVLQQSELALDQHDRVDRVIREIRDAASEHDLWAHGDIEVVPSDAALSDVLNWISASAGFVRNGGVVKPYREPGFNLALVARENAQGLPLTGPAGQQDLLPRFVRTLNDKAQRMQSTRAEWLCVEALTGLFGFTGWAQLDMPRKVATLEAAIREGLQAELIRGVVVCSAAAQFLGTVNEEVAETHGGSVGLRYPVVPLRAREVIIVPLRDSARPAAQLWRRMFESERDWFTWALADSGLPSFEEITEDTAVSA